MKRAFLCLTVGIAAAAGAWAEEDRVIFKCYGVSDDDAKYIKRWLKEMP